MVAPGIGSVALSVPLIVKFWLTWTVVVETVAVRVVGVLNQVATVDSNS